MAFLLSSGLTLVAQLAMVWKPVAVAGSTGGLPPARPTNNPNSTGKNEKRQCLWKWTEVKRSHAYELRTAWDSEYLSATRTYQKHRTNAASTPDH